MESDTGRMGTAIHRPPAEGAVPIHYGVGWPRGVHPDLGAGAALSEMNNLPKDRQLTNARTEV